MPRINKNYTVPLALFIIWLIVLGISIYFLNDDYNKYAILVIPALSLVTFWAALLATTYNSRIGREFSIPLTLTMLLGLYIVHVVYWNLEYGLSNLFLWNLSIIIAVAGMMIIPIIYAMTMKIY